MGPYWSIVSHPVLRRVWPGLVLSALGDGMAEVGVGWLALRLAPAGQRGIWVALAVAAYSLPASPGRSGSAGSCGAAPERSWPGGTRGCAR